MPRYDREYVGGDFRLSVDSDPTVINGIVKFGETDDWIQFGTLAERVGLKFMMESTATSGTAYGMQIRMKTSAAGGGAVGLNVSASNSIAASGGLQAIQGYAQPALACAAGVTNAICALYGKTWPVSGLDAVAPIWSLWVDNGADTKSTGGHYMARFSNNAVSEAGSGVEIDGLFTVYAGSGMTNLINFEAPLIAPVSTSPGTLTATHKIAIKIGDDTRYIHAGTVA